MFKLCLNFLKVLVIKTLNPEPNPDPDLEPCKDPNSVNPVQNTDL
jgi:hypothetical protein